MISDQDHVNGASDEGSLAPLSQVYQLTNGRGIVRLEMPDMLKFADGSFDIPNRMQADIYELIYGNGSFESVVAQFNYNKQRLRGLYALFALVCVEPKFVLDDDDRKAGELGPRSVGWVDVMVAYNFFRFGPTRSLSATTDQEPELVAPIATTEKTD
jgi:hypothetical protein